MSNTNNSGKYNQRRWAVPTILLIGLTAVGAIAYFTGGFTSEFKTFYVTVDGKDIMTSASGYTISPSEPMKVDVMFYYYCSKCEHEVVITDFPPHITPEELERLTAERDEHIAKYGNPQYSHSVRVKNALKIDVYEQIMINWEHFLDYVWNERQKAHKK